MDNASQNVWPDYYITTIFVCEAGLNSVVKIPYIDAVEVHKQYMYKQIGGGISVYLCPDWQRKGEVPGCN